MCEISVKLWPEAELFIPKSEYTAGGRRSVQLRVKELYLFCIVLTTTVTLTFQGVYASKYIMNESKHVSYIFILKWACYG
jgi:hypothetical protein